MNVSELWSASPMAVDAAFSVLWLIVILVVSIAINMWIDE